jgi:hypothetical protein
MRGDEGNENYLNVRSVSPQESEMIKMTYQRNRWEPTMIGIGLGVLTAFLFKQRLP